MTLLVHESVAKVNRQAYTARPHLPPYRKIARQVEKEAGDCEGRLPFVFVIQSAEI